MQIEKSGDANANDVENTDECVMAYMTRLFMCIYATSLILAFLLAIGYAAEHVGFPWDLSLSLSFLFFIFCYLIGLKAQYYVFVISSLLTPLLLG